MVQQRRAFFNVPDYQKTKQNDREFYVLDDPQFEPEDADFLIGYIGDVSILTEEDLERTPQILEDTPERQKYQLTIGTTFINPVTQQRVTGAFYTDLVGQISANGGLTEDPNRVFSTNYYAWTPPVDYDKHINFGRYFWMAPGAGDLAGEFIIKEPQGSKTTIYVYNGTDIEKRDVKLYETLPATDTTDTYAELTTEFNRSIYRFNGTDWVLQEFRAVPDVPTDFTELTTGDTFYVGRTGPDFNRPLVWLYGGESRRWIAQQVIVNVEEPDLKRIGMVWEDLRVPRTRRLKRWNGTTWINLSYTVQAGPSGVGEDGDYIYDSRDYNDITDEWSNNNWWRHLEDLSSTDQEFVLSEDQATRPILEFWAGIEQDGFIDRDEDGLRDRNDPALYKKYAYILDSNEIVDTGEKTTIFEYVVGTGEDDFVLGFPLSFNDSGEILFDLTLESDASEFEGYKYFLDTITGLAHSVWHKSDIQLEQEEDEDGLYDVPRSLSSNSDHQILTESSRSQYLLHMSSVIEEQEDFSGDRFGPNSWRWSKKSPARGSTIIDSEQTLLRAMGLLQNVTLGGMPQVIRRMGSEYNKVIFRFTNRMNQKWDNLDLSDSVGNLIVTVEEAVDSILTELFVGRNEQFPYFYSDMGTYQETIITSGNVEVVDTEEKPIYIPPSPPRVGPAPCYTPESFTDRDGVDKLRGHEGIVIRSFGDDRDLIWLNLQERFFNAVPDFYKTETEDFSARFVTSNFWLDDYFGDYNPDTSTEPVDEVVEDYNDIVSPTQNQRVYSTSQAQFANYDGNSWLTRNAVTDEIFFDNDTESYFIFNGLGTHQIDDWNRPFEWDYSDQEFRRILRREFERFILFREDDFAENIDFDANDPFTWNYSSSGVEGNYRGIYRRVYNSIRPHNHPWEVVGYRIEPSWWRTEYPPTSTASDGTPRYSNSDPMWTDLQNGIYNPITGAQRDDLIMAGPIPVDEDGELLDPIAAGVVDPEKLDSARIDDVWTYGDGYEIEQNFIDSAFYPYSFSLQGYLMKNGIWTDTVWSEVYITIGEDTNIQIATAPHVIHRDTLTRPAVEDLPVHLQELDDGTIVQRLGVNAWVSEFVQIIGGSPTNDFALVIQNTEAALSWKTSGYIRENRTTVAFLSNEEIPSEDVYTILHASQPIDQQFCSGVVIIREDPTGYRVFGYDTTNPFFRVELPALPNIGGQVEARESFTAEEDQHTFTTESLNLPFNVFDNDTAKLSVIIDGQRIKPQHIRTTSKRTFEIEDKIIIEGGEEVTATVVTTPSNPSTQIRQFRIEGVSIPYAAKGSGEIVDVEYGRFFETSNEVINFMIGYGRVLESEGWVFDDVDETTGQARDWLFGAKQFAAWVLDNESVWQPSQNSITSLDNLTRFEYSPIERKAKYVFPFGQNFNVESLQNGTYGILNRESQPIEATDTFSARSGDTLEVEVNEDAQDVEKMYGLRVNVTEIQHVVFFSNVTRFNDLIYDPVTALFHRTLKVDSYRTNDWNGRLEAPGYLVSGGTLIPNFEKNAFDFTRFYDRIRPLDDPERRDQGRNLYGWYPADEYMDPIGAADRSRFDYYRGMINAKGTLRAIIAYTRGTRIGRDNVFVYEDWAWKVAEYGDVRREKIQFNIDKNEITDQATVICFGCEENIFNNTLEVQDYNRTNTVIGSVYILDLPDPQFSAGQGFVIQVDNKVGDIVLENDSNLFEAIEEINAKLLEENIVEVEVFNAGGFLAFRNTVDFTITEYTLLSGFLQPDILVTAGIDTGTYNVDNERWIMPAPTGQDGISNVEFPVDENGLPDVENNTFLSKTFDTDPLETVNTHFHNDPGYGQKKVDPVAGSLVDLAEVLDPARYNRGPGASNSNNLVWGENQVGSLWWDTTRAKYVDYRRPFDGSDTATFPEPDYETSAKVWGRLLFYRADIERVDEVATVTTKDIYNDQPTEHGLQTGDTVTIVDAEPEDWNVEDQEIFLSPVDVLGTIPFQEDDATGSVEIPSTVTTTGNNQYDELNTVTGTEEFESTNITDLSTTNTDSFYRSGDAFRIDMPSTSILVDFQTAAGGTASFLSDEINDALNSAGIFEVESFSEFDTINGGLILGFRNRLNREGVPFELFHIENSFTGTESSPSFAVGDEFTVITSSGEKIIFIQGPDTSTSGVVTEINTALSGAGLTECESFDDSGALGFRTTGGNEDQIYTLSPGQQGPDLLEKAGIDPGDYGSVLSKAGIASKRYDDATIVGVDEVGAGNAPSFGIFTDSDILFLAGIDENPDDPDPPYTGDVIGTNDLSSLTIRDDSQFAFQFNRQLSAPYTTTQTTLSALITEFNNYLVSEGVNEITMASTGTNELKIEFTSTTPEDFIVRVPVEDGLNVVGTVNTPTFAVGDDCTITTASGTLNFVSTVSGDQSALAPDINTQLTGAGITEVEAYDASGFLGFQNTAGSEGQFFTLEDDNNDVVGTVASPTFAIGDDMSLTETSSTTVVNISLTVAGNTAAVVPDINSQLSTGGVTEIEAYDNGGSLAFRNIAGNEGAGYTLTAGTVNDILTTAGLPAGTIRPGVFYNAGVAQGTYVGSIWQTAGLPGGSYDSENISDAVGTVSSPTFLVGQQADFELLQTSFVYTSDEDQDLDSLVDSINGSFSSNSLDNDMEAVNDSGSLRFNLLTTQNSYRLSRLGGITEFENPESTGIVGVISSVNLALQDANIFTVESFFDEFKFGLRNTLGNEGRPFYLENGSPVDLLDLVGITDLTYEIIPAGYSFNIETRSGEFPASQYETPYSAGLDDIIADINNWFSNPDAQTVTEVQAINSDQRLAFQNTSGNEGKGFRLINGSPDDLLGPPPGADFSFIAGAFFEIIPADAGFDISTSSGKLQFNSEGGNLDFVIDEINEQLPFANTIGTVNSPTYASGDDFTISVFSNITKTLNFSNNAATNVADLVVEINDAFASLGNPITEVQAVDDNNHLKFENALGIPEIAFLLTAGTVNDILATSGIEDRLYGGITEVEATRDENFLRIQNRTGREAEYFVLDSPTNPSSTTDLLVTAGLDATSYGQYQAESGFDIVLDNNKGVVFSTPDGGTLSKIVEEINSEFDRLNLFEVEAYIEDDSLGFRNTQDSSGVGFELSPGDPDLLSATGISAGTYESDPTTFSFIIETDPGTPAGGDPKVIVGEIDLYEWVRSPVPPEEWVDYTNTLTAPDKQTGEPLNVDDPSYVELTFTNERTNQEQSVYYFWVKDNTGTNQEKELSTSVIARRLESPTSQAIPWFAPMDKDHMLIYQGTRKVEDDYAIELFIDARELETHVEWVLISENDRFNSVPDDIVDKIIDSMSEEDDKGNTVPSPLLNDFEKYGSSFFPIQTIYSDVEEAVDVYVEALNDLLSTKDLSRFDPLVSIFQLDDELSDSNPNGFWQRSRYVEEEYADKEIFDTVVTEEERDRRGDAGFYVNDDLVDVLQSSNTDPWIGGPYTIIDVSSANKSFTIADDETDKFRNGESFVVRLSTLNDGQYNVVSSSFDGTNTEIFVTEDVNDAVVDGFITSSVTTTYLFQDDLFIEVGVENHTVAINNNIRQVTSKFRSTYYRTYDVLEKEEQNSLTFSMLYEMMRQHLNADWFIKTSYISTQIFDKISRSPFVRASEPQAILENINDVKPFRTKFLTQSETRTVEEVEDVPTQIIEFPDIKTTMLVDRLSCNDTEDGGWDGDYWDSENPPTVGWDRPFWEFEDLGREEWVTVGVIEGGTPETVFEFEPEFSPNLYDHRALFFDNGTLIDPDVIGFTATFETTPTILRVTLNVALTVNFTVDVQQAQGLVQGEDPTLPQNLIDQGFQVTEGTYEHHVPRVFNNGTVDRSNPTEGIIGCEGSTVPGGKSEERIPSDVIPSVNICVINTFSESLGAWDAAPWDTAEWDTAPADIGDRIFLIAVGEQEEIPPSTEVFEVSETFQDGDSGFAPPYIIGPEEYTVVQIEVQVGGTGTWNIVTEGVEYEVVEPFRNTIEFGGPPDQTFITDGVSTLYGPVVSPTDISLVRLNSTPLSEGVDYLVTNISGEDFIDFTIIQPAPRSVTENFEQKGSWIEGDSSRTTFEVNLPQDSLTKDNVMVFRDGILEPQANYEVATIADVELLTDPPTPIGEFISTIALGNFRQDDQTLGIVQNFSGTGSQTNYVVGNDARVENTWVFVDGVYQAYGATEDYTFNAAGTSSAEIIFNVAPAGGTDIEVRIINSPLGNTTPYVDMEHIVFAASGTTVDSVPGLYDIDDPNHLMIFVSGVLKNGYSGEFAPPEYTIQSNLPSTDEIVWNSGDEPSAGETISLRFTRNIIVTETIEQDVLPVAGDTLTIEFERFLENNDIVRYRYNGWPVGRLGPFEVTDFPDEGFQTFSGNGVDNIFIVGNNATEQNTTVFVDGLYQQVGDDYEIGDEGLPTASIIFETAPPSGTDNIEVDTYLGFDSYTIEDGILTLPQEIPDIGQTITVEFKETRRGDLNRSILVRMEIIAVEILSDHEDYENPKDGVIVVDTSDANYWQWDAGTQTWNIYAAAAPGDQVYVRTPMQIWGYDGTSFELLFNVGDSYTTPPLIEYPSYGTGIVSGTYTMGQNVSAEDDFPEAWLVIQFPGDCGSGC